MSYTLTIHPTLSKVISKEPTFSLFKHNELLCCVVRTSMGNFNGYVAVDKSNSLYGKHYSDHVFVEDKNKIENNGNSIGLLCYAFSEKVDTNLVPIDLAINVHGGITYSDSKLWYIDNSVFDELWWFGFDTVHAGDLKPYQNEIDLQYQIHSDEYRTFEYVKNEAIKLAEQLNQFNPTHP